MVFLKHHFILNGSPALIYGGEIKKSGG